MIKIFKKENLWGIEENGIICIPFCHIYKIDAIMEWEYWETLNNKKQFLNHKLTIEEIAKKVEELKTT
jgi:hypothetical protein